MGILRKFFSKFLLCKADSLKNDVICYRSYMEGISSSSTKHDDRQPSNLSQIANDFSLEMNRSKKIQFDFLKDRELTQTKMKLDDQVLVDDFNFLSRHDHDQEILTISDETYAAEVQLKEVLLYSSIVGGEIDNDNNTLSRNLEQKETFEEDESSSSSSSFSSSTSYSSASSQSKHYYCATCMEAKPIEEMFENLICSHSFCQDCIRSYLATKIQENIAMVKCPYPNCNGILEPYDCISIIPEEVFERWENALCENSILESQKIYFPYDCAICMEAKPIEEMFENRICSHSFCQDCVGSYLAAKVQENIAMVKCPYPNCNGILEPYDCISIIPEEVFKRWENALCENSILASQKMYCPYNDCSAMLVNDVKGVVTNSECPHCHKLFCAQCKVPWHAGVDCREFQSLKVGERGTEDLMAMELARKKRWKRCPKCSFFVEKSVGCTHISCRCGHEFCYGCGSTWNNNSHYKCRK